MNISQNNNPFNASPEMAPPTQAEPIIPEVEKQKQGFSGLTFDPVSDSTPKAFVQPKETNSIFDFAIDAFDKKTVQSVGSKTADLSEPTKAAEIIPEGMIAVSADIFVEIYEATVQAACQFFGDENGKYLFDKHYKEKFKIVAEKYFRAQNIMVTPTQLFLLMAVALASGSAIRAFKDRSKKMKAEKAARNTVKRQQQNDSSESGEKYDVYSGQRRFFSLDENGYYDKNPNGVYVKKDEREKPSADLLPIIKDHFAKNGKWPKYEHLKTYLQN